MSEADKRAFEDALAEVKAFKGRLGPKATAGELAELTAKVNRLDQLREQLKTNDKIDLALKDLGPASDDGIGGDSLWSAILAKGFDLDAGVHRVSLGAVYGQKAIMADGTDANILQLPAVRGLGQDDRFAFSAFPSVGLGDAVSVQGLVQTVRTLATPADMDVAITGSTSKPESMLTAALTTVDAEMVAHTTELIPNAIFNLPSFGPWIQREMRFGLGRGIDDKLVTDLAAASGTNTYAQGAETLHEAYAHALAEVKSSGYRADLVMINPSDNLDLELLRDANDRYYADDAPFSVKQVRFVESNAVTAGLPIAVDSEAFGMVYVGATQWAVNPYEEFRTNRSRGRLEVPMLVFVDDPLAIQEITLA